MTEDEARDQLRRMVASDTFPTLDGYELSGLLRMARRPDRWGILDVDVPDPTGATRTAAEGVYAIWAPGTVYALNATVVPTRRNGHVYTCTTGGTSGSTEPAFNTAALSTTTDNGVVWTETDATVWEPTYDLNAAAAEGWRWKAGKTSDRITFGSQGDNYNADQLHKHCIEMAKYYESRVVRTIKVYSMATKPLDAAKLPRAN